MSPWGGDRSPPPPLPDLRLWVAIPPAPGRLAERLREGIFIENRLCAFTYMIPANFTAVDRDLLSPASQGADSEARRSDLACGGHIAGQ